MIQNNLKKLREKLDINQTEFARLLNVLPTQYNIWERQLKQPNLENIMKICSILKIKVEDLIEYIPDIPK
jgi:DNA-binding XRE family transcriptional regulator